jgi:hypothetical protein
MSHPITIEIVSDDATAIKGDVLSLKFAQARYGVDAFVFHKLLEAGQKKEKMSPKPGCYSLLPTAHGIAANKILFIGVFPRYEFGYTQVREHGRLTLTSLAGIDSKAKRVIVTVHGVGFGLDEPESFESQIAGFIDAVKSAEIPDQLERITFAEKNSQRAERLKRILEEILPNGIIEFDTRWNIKNVSPNVSEILRSAGYASNSKKHVFVAMPFRSEMEDIYDYGISPAVRSAGYLCERADLSSFTGDVMQWVRERIKSATLVVAELTGSNPNVYLEVGYAWGCSVPTVLLVNDTENLKFDVRGQRCIVYKRIKDIEAKLSKEIQGLNKI